MITSTDDLDRALLQAIAHGETQALEKLYAQHGLSLLNYLMGMLRDAALAEEVLQNVMLSVWKAAGNFRGESKVRTWLIAIARNHAINSRRKRALHAVELHEEERDHKTGPMEAVIRDSERDQVRAAIRMLPEEQQETLELVFYHGLSGAEAAAVLGVSEGTIKSRLHRAKAHLKELLQEREEPY
jgi:RNA polymerase sigma-70 factor (ECF subfamily)